MATYTMLRSGEWGIRIRSTKPAEIKAGGVYRVEKKNGEEKRETVESVVWAGNGVAICTIRRTAPAPVPAPKVMGSGHGWNNSGVPGFSNYCTDRDDCGCYDCAS